MILLVSVELERALRRRAIRVVAAVMALGIVVAFAITFLRSSPPSASDHRRDERTRARYLETCLESPSSLGEGAPAGFGEPGSPERERFCREQLSRIQFPSTVQDRRFFLRNLRGIFAGTTGPLAMAALIFGASLIGAEWRAGTVATTLTWEPRRGPLFAAKLIAAVVVSCALFLAAHLLLGALFWLIAVTRGVTTGADARWFGQLLGQELRCLLLVAYMAAFGFSVGSVGRNTAAALGVAFGYLMLFEQFLTAVRWLRPWLIVVNAVSFVAGDAADDFLRDPTKAGITITLYVAGAVAIAFASFRRRDVAA